MKKLFLLPIFAMLFASCNSKNVAPFEIGDSKKDVINTILNDFTICGEKWSIDRILDRLNTDRSDGREWITLYECVYNEQEYYKVRIYFDLSDKVCRMELEIEKDKMKNLHKRLKNKYGDSRRANLPRGLPGLPPMWEISTVYVGDIDGVIVTEDNQEVVRTQHGGTTTNERSDVYELIIVSGEQYYELKRFL